MEAWRSFAGQVDAFLGENYAGMDWRLFESEWRANASLTAAAGGRSMGTPESLDWRSLPFSHPTAPLCGVVLYFTGIALLKRYMRDREPIKLPTAMLLHNGMLCLLSAVMLLGVVYEAVLVFQEYGLEGIWNDKHWVLPRSGVPFWCYIFYVSKYYELLDTAFLLLKKREPEFVQLWHHAVVLVLFWSYLEARMMNHWWLVAANCFVHVFVYGYFAAATLKIDVWFKHYITVLQISQFVFDMGYSLPFYMWKQVGDTRGDWEPWYFGQFIGATFIFLFARIYVRIQAARKRKREAKAQAALEEAKAKKGESKESARTPSRSKSPARARSKSRSSSKPRASGAVRRRK